jgi:ATP-dependent exoDNAse (exonuclease V) beta subunit
VWPDLRLRGSLLGADDVAALAEAREAGGSAVDRRAELLAEERRLFYVAVTRAKERLVVTAVAGDEGEDRPSRFLEELASTCPSGRRRSGRPLTGSGCSPSCATSPRARPTRRCARRPAGGWRWRPVQAARRCPTWRRRPDRWWGLSPLSDESPLVGEGERVRVSPSKVEAFDTCSLRWFLESGVGVASSSGPAQVVGSLVHALAELGSGADALDEAALTARLDEVLPELDLGAPWAVRRRREEAVEQLRKFLRWQAAGTRELSAPSSPCRCRWASAPCCRAGRPARA